MLWQLHRIVGELSEQTQGSKPSPVYVQERRRHKIIPVNECQIKFYVEHKIALMNSLLQSSCCVFAVEVSYRKIKKGTCDRNSIFTGMLQNTRVVLHCSQRSHCSGKMYNSPEPSSLSIC